MAFYTNHKYKGAHHYICVDESPDCTIDLMPNYILHMNMNAIYYV
jgi:hypothetical protein